MIFKNRYVICLLEIFVILANIFLETGCDNPITRPNDPVVSWDTTFSISGIQFPNDTIFNRAITSSGSNYRLKKFIEKCKNNDAIRIGFIGGSITAGAIVSTKSFRYSSRLCEWIHKCFPGLKQVVELNAGISATDSRFGCSRIKTDLLDQRPDIVIIDFAVNDWGIGDSEYICSNMEGLVRQCLNYKNDMPVILLFFSKGDGTNVQELQSSVGTYYSLPMISYRDAIWPLVKDNIIQWGTLFYNDPHPNDNGHLLASYLLYTYIKKEISMSQDQEISIPVPKYSDIYQYASVLSKNDTSLKVEASTWQMKINESGRCGFTSSQLSDSLILNSNCQEVTIGIHMQPSTSSNIRVLVDDGLLDTTLSNSYPVAFPKFTRLYLSDKILKHNIRVYHLDSNPDTIDYFLYARK